MFVVKWEQTVSKVIHSSFTKHPRLKRLRNTRFYQEQGDEKQQAVDQNLILEMTCDQVDEMLTLDRLLMASEWASEAVQLNTKYQRVLSIAETCAQYFVKGGREGLEKFHKIPVQDNIEAYDRLHERCV